MTMTEVADDLSELAGLAGAMAGMRQSVASWPADAMGSTMRAVATLVAEATRLQVVAASHFTRLGAFRADGATSTAAWLRDRLPLGGGMAKRIDDAARAIATVDIVGAAFIAGALEVEQAAMLVGLCDRVGAGTCAVDELLPLLDKAAELSVERFRQEVRAVELRLDQGKGIDPAERRAMRSHDGEAGTKVWRLELEADAHTVVGSAVDLLVNEFWRATKGADSRPSATELPRLRADAAVEMAHRVLAGQASAASGPRAGSGRATPEVIVLIDHRTLIDGIVRADSECRLVDGTPISAETARRIACEAGIFPAVLGGPGEVLDLGRSRRLASAAQHRLLRIAYRTCGFPGCDVPVHWTKAHHVDPWVPRRGKPPGRTDIANLVPLCENHHHFVHEGGWTVARVDDRFVWRTPAGQEFLATSAVSRAAPSRAAPSRGAPSRAAPSRAAPTRGAR